MRTANGSMVGAVVDAYSTGNFLRESFAKLDTRLVHVQSTAELLSSLPALDFSNYLDNIVHIDEESTLARLREYAPAFIAVGQEPGVPLADRLSELMELASNGSALSAARRDKYQMIETLREAGLHCAEQTKTDDVATAVDWAERGGYPVVVKPVSSGASDGVFVCADAAAVARAVETVLGSSDIFDQRNREVLLQSYLTGTEYIVDTVSCAGQRYVCGVWRYEKSLLAGGRNIYDRDVLMEPDADPVPELIAYVDKVLAALNIQWGAGHAEVIMTPKGPALVEIGARLNGNMHPGFHDVCLGHNQSDLTALAYVRPAEFRASFGDRIYRKLQDAVVYNAPTTADGIVAAVDDRVVREITELPSTHTVTVKLRRGSRIRPTVDLLTSPLRVFLTSPDPSRLASDCEAVRDLKDGVYLLS